MAGSWYAVQSLALCVWFGAFCHAVPKWSNLPQNPQTLMFQQTDQRFQQPVQQQASQQFSPQFQQLVQQQASQRFPQPVQQASQPFPQSVQQQGSQPFPQSVQQQASQWFPQPAQQASQQFPQQFPQSVQQQASQQFPQQFQPKQPVAQAEPLDKCTVSDYEQIQCGPPGISGAECAAINCCFNGQQCYYGKAVTVQCIRDGQFVVVVARDVTLPRLSLDSVRLLGGNDPACSPVGSTPFFAIYQFPVTACGTSMMEDSGYVVYENRMTSSYEVGMGPLGSITRDSHFELLFQCRYSGTSVEALVVEVNTVPPPPPVAAPGPLRVELRLANGQCVTKGCAEGDEAYTSYYSDADYPVTKVLREPVYVEVHILERTDPNIVLMLGHCWVTSTPSPLSLPQWDLLVDGCPYQDDRYLTTLVPVAGSSGLQFPTHYKRFVVKMFTFVDPASLAPLQETVFIHCSTEVCHPSSGSCQQSCSRQSQCFLLFKLFNLACVLKVVGVLNSGSGRTCSGVDAELMRLLVKAVDRLGLEWSPSKEPALNRLDGCFLQRRHQPPASRPAPFLPELHAELSKSGNAPFSARLYTSVSATLSRVDGAAEKGTTSALVGRAFAARQAASALHSMAILQILQADLLREWEEKGSGPAAIADLRSATDLSLRATKAAAQVIGRSMAALTATERHLWLTLADMRESEHATFLNAPLSPTGLFGPAVNGIVDRFSEVQKTSQAMNLFLPRRSSSATGRSRDKPPARSSTQRPAKPAASQRRQGGRLRSRSDSRHRPPPPRGPRPRIVLKPEQAKPS
ncbi:uncharacterized protein LOC130106389 [Rhinichthys klamathensis goyatoka]|uniref:uncharacterized protein LOC130106389 n=1 Tax=Rhinichthys klamathensis goyatoka TaxID=3034132 RepID=UPI0024B619FD|nr:uncharacterized protein LOC130106389 [Rhinichthys klamathensis goyatoka]